MMGATPHVSVIIPARNAAGTIGCQLEALANQRAAPPFEVIVADNGSGDETAAIAQSFSGRLDLRVVDASECRGAGFARNAGAAIARTPYLLFCDADDRVGSGWIRAMHEALSSHDIVTGPLILAGPAPIFTEPEIQSRRQESPRYRYLEVVTYAAGSNMGLTARLFSRLSGFDREMRYCQDADLSLRARLLGSEPGWAPEAVVFRTARASLAAAVSQHFFWGVYDALLYKKLQLSGTIERTKWQMTKPYLVLAARSYWLLTARRHWWIKWAARRAGRIVGSLRAGVVCP